MNAEAQSGRRLRIFRILLVVAALSAGSVDADGGADARLNVVHFLQRSAATALIRIDSVRTVEEFRDASGRRVGYAQFEVTGTVLEAFKGIETGNIAFLVTQEQPSHPPTGGEYIVSLDRLEDGRLAFADDSVWWVAATPDLIRAARTGR